MAWMRSMQVEDDAPLPPIPADLGLNKPTRAGVEAFRQLITSIRRATARGTPADALNHIIAQVRPLPRPRACIAQLKWWP